MNIEITNETIEKMAEAFCRWNIPESVLPDECVMNRDYPRTRTNFFTVEEAKQAIRFMFDNIIKEII